MEPSWLVLHERRATQPSLWRLQDLRPLDSAETWLKKTEGVSSLSWRTLVPLHIPRRHLSTSRESQRVLSYRKGTDCQGPKNTSTCHVEGGGEREWTRGGVIQAGKCALTNKLWNSRLLDPQRTSLSGGNAGWNLCDNGILRAMPTMRQTWRG